MHFTSVPWSIKLSVINGTRGKNGIPDSQWTRKTLEEAKHSALRNAIEQAFGAFISSKTEILNDDLVKDEIVSISNGNIHSVEVISEVQISEGRYATTLKTTVSVTKLTSFVTSKGVEVEFKGSLFAFNISQQKLNEKNEVKAIEDLCEVIRTLADNSFNYTLHTSNPISIDGSNEQWKIPMYISVYANSNIYNISKYMNTTLKGISLSNIDANNYMNLGKKVFPISLPPQKKITIIFYSEMNRAFKIFYVQCIISIMHF